MNELTWLPLLIFITLLLLAVKPLGGYMARVFQGERTWISPVLVPIEKLIYRAGGIDPQNEMGWKTYTIAVLLFNFLGFIFLFVLLLFQKGLPFNPQSFSGIHPLLAFNIAVSFVTNTNWQSYAGETTLSYLTQMLGLGLQNFLSAATGITVLIALIRGISRQSSTQLGNFWVDLTKSILYILLPFSVLLSLVLVSQGTVQSFKPYQEIGILDPSSNQTSQYLPLGPAASQIAIKQLGTNGGGFF